jgi:hypothetical protein
MSLLDTIMVVREEERERERERERETHLCYFLLGSAEEEQRAEVHLRIIERCSRQADTLDRAEASSRLGPRRIHLSDHLGFVQNYPIPLKRRRDRRFKRERGRL